MTSLLVGGGSLLFIVADNANGVAREVYAVNDAAEVAALIEASEVEWDVWFAIGGAALLVTALGL